MFTVRSHRLRLMCVAAGSAIATCAANGQFTWVSPVDGAWTDPARWNPTGVPNSATASAVLGPGAYSVLIPSNIAVSAVTIGAGTHINLAGGSSVFFNSAAALINDGIFTINSNGSELGTGFTLQFSDLTLSGTGALVFNASPGNLDTARVSWYGGGESLINNAGHTIRGAGRIATYLTNGGTVDANVAGATFWLSDRTKTNNAIMKATSGGTLAVSCRVDQSGTAMLTAADSGTVAIDGTVAGGAVGSTGAGSIVFNGNAAITGGTTLFGTLAVPSGSHVWAVNTDVVNNGVLTINPEGGAAGAGLTIQGANTTWSGSGTLRLNADPANLDTAAFNWYFGGEAFVNSAGHSIRGSGRILTALVNNGLVAADLPGRTLLFTNQAKTNNANMQATGGGNLTFSCGINQSPTALISSDADSSLTFAGATLTSGTVTAAPASTMTFSGSNTLLGDPTLNGKAVIPNTGRLTLTTSTLTQNGLLVVNPAGGADGTGITLAGADCAINGAGTIRLHADPATLDAAAFNWYFGGERVTNGAAHTISGTGRIQINTTNDGSILADDAGGTFWLSDRPKINNGLMKATGGGTLYIQCGVSQAANARVAADTGSVVHFQGGSLDGGLLQSSGTGVVRAAGNWYLGSVTATADIRVLPANTIWMANGVVFTNNGTLTVGDLSATEGATLALQGTDAPVTLAGTGTLFLAGAANNPQNALITWYYAGERLVNSGQHTIRGTGRIQPYLTNDGTISSDSAGSVIWLTDREKTNNNLIRARNGGNITFQCPLTQSAAGRVVVETGSSAAFYGGSVSGGELQSSGTGSISVGGNAYIGTLTNRSSLNYLSAHTVYMSEGTHVTNYGTVSLGDAAATAVANLTLQGGSSVVEFTGPGKFVLGAPASDPGLAVVHVYYGTEVFHNGPGHTLAGSGRIRTNLNNDGIISPGPASGGIGLIHKAERAMTCGPTSQINIEIASATSYDAISGDPAINLGGTLDVTAIGGYIGGIGTIFTIIHGGVVNGEFAAVHLPAHPVQGLKYGIEYASNEVRVRVTCNADFNSDGVIDLFDYLDFVNVFSTGNVVADYNADGVTDFFDYLDFLQDFARGCN